MLSTIYRRLYLQNSGITRHTFRARSFTVSDVQRWWSQGSSSDGAASNTTPSVNALNHVAIAVPDIVAAMEKYKFVFGAEVSEPQALPDHGVTVSFVKLANTKLELLEPLGEKSPIANFLMKNPAGGIHHICLEVNDIHHSLQHVTQYVNALNSSPKIGAHGTQVVFLHPKDCNGVLVELEETGSSANNPGHVH